MSAKLGASIFFLFSLNTNTPALLHPNHCCPLCNCSLRKLNAYLNAVAISQTQEGFTMPPLWNCLQQIFLKTLFPNTSLSFEDEFDVWELSKDLTYKEPSLVYEVWVI